MGERKTRNYRNQFGADPRVDRFPRDEPFLIQTSAVKNGDKNSTKQGGSPRKAIGCKKLPIRLINSG